MKLKGEIGPTFKFGDKKVTMSISKSGFNAWKEGHPMRNALVFAASFMYERAMLIMNDVVVAITGRNFFFPNKPQQFHDEVAKYCRCAVAVRALLWKLAGWKSLLFLYLCETLWSIPPHPACAMFVTNHGSTIDEQTGTCIPSSSTYAGKWYSLLTCKYCACIFSTYIIAVVYLTYSVIHISGYKLPLRAPRFPYHTASSALRASKDCT